MGLFDSIRLRLQGWSQVRDTQYRWCLHDLAGVEVPAGWLFNRSKDGIISLVPPKTFEADFVINVSAGLNLDALSTAETATALTNFFATTRTETSPRIERRCRNADCLDVELKGSADEGDVAWFHRSAYRGHITATATVVGDRDDFARHRRAWIDILDSLILSDVQSSSPRT